MTTTAPEMLDKPATILLVDDEPSILRSVARLLRREGYTILSAESAVQALNLLEEHDVDLLISDVRMPGMDGVSLLGKVRSRWPECMRILLTGDPDLEATIAAINHGEIHRYVLKPWNDAELTLAVQQCLRYQFSERERTRLEQLTLSQNEQLTQWAAKLEERVKQRTASLEETTRLLTEAHLELERGFVMATEVFSSLINKRLPKSRQTNQEVLAWVRAYCETHDVDAESARDLEMAAALYNLGKLTWRDGMIALPLNQLEKEDRARYQQYPGVGETLLIGLHPAQKAALLIRHHQERFDGGGFPDGLSGDQIPWEARLLKVIVDYVELQRGMLVSRKVPAEEALELIVGSTGRVYDSALVGQFDEVVKKAQSEKGESQDAVGTLAPHALAPGMILAQPLYTNDGVLMLNKGKALTERLIERLRQLEKDEGVPLVLHILEAVQDESQ